MSRKFVNVFEDCTQEVPKSKKDLLSYHSVRTVAWWDGEILLIEWWHTDHRGLARETPPRHVAEVILLNHRALAIRYAVDFHDRVVEEHLAGPFQADKKGA